MSIPVARLNHAVLFVRDASAPPSSTAASSASRSSASEFGGKAVFMRSAGGDNHHDLGLFSVGPEAPRAPRGSVGLYHLAWEVPTIEDLADAARILSEARCARRRMRPRRLEVALRPRSGRQRVRDHVARPARGVGRRRGSRRDPPARHRRESTASGTPRPSRPAGLTPDPARDPRAGCRGTRADGRRNPRRAPFLRHETGRDMKQPPDGPAAAGMRVRAASVQTAPRISRSVGAALRGPGLVGGPEAAAATAGGDRVRVVDGEAGAHQRVDVVDLRALERSMRWPST